MLITGCAAASEPTPEPTRVQTADPLTQQEAMDCISAEAKLTIVAIVAGETFRPVQFMDLVEERGNEYLGDALGSPLPTAIPEPERLAALAGAAERLSRDADIALACRMSILPALAEAQ